MKKYTHNATGRLYLVIGKCKIKINNQWIDGILYFDAKDNYYVRTTEDFNSKFTAQGINLESF